MAAKKSSTKGPSAVETALAALGREATDEAIDDALRSPHARVTAAAAQQVKARLLPGHTAALEAAWSRFLDDGVKKDPGCRAKLAVLEALDFTESMHDAPFLAACELVQEEPAWGPPVDTATGCRARGVLALARLGHQDLLIVAGRLLADPLAPVRIAAADAVASSGQRGAAGLLLHKLAIGDDDGLVSLSCMSGVLALAPDVALKQFTPLLVGKADEERELAALCFAQSNRADAGAALIEAVKQTVLSKPRGALLRTLGLHRSDAALDALLEVVTAGNEHDARQALTGLAQRRYEGAVRERVLAAVTSDPSLRRLFDELFT